MIHFIIYLLFAFLPNTDSISLDNETRPGDNGRDDIEIIIKDDLGG